MPSLRSWPASGFWVVDINNSPPPNAAGQATTSAPAITPSDPTHAAASVTQWNWRKPLPIDVRVGASYGAAYYLGWLFRRMLRPILEAGALAMVLLGLGKFAGWEMMPARDQVKRSGERAQRATTTTTDHLKSLLPSATASGMGVFLGFRRRNRAGISEPVVTLTVNRARNQSRKPSRRCW